MNQYLIKKVSDDFNLTGNLNSQKWNNANNLEVNLWPWHDFSLYDVPEVNVKILYTDNNLYVRFHVKENYILARKTNFQDQVCEDSCVEFFVSPTKSGYFNFEVNCIGTIHLHFHEDRHISTTVSDSDLSTIRMATSLPKGVKINTSAPCPKVGYVVEYSVPFKLLTKYSDSQIPTKNSIWHANLYKCGDLSQEPSWGTWSPIDTKQPDFHQPKYFGEIIFD
ncbi:MAG: diguanylate cyclase [bacterium]|nr:diguanylate cyclase [bacterium]